MTPFVLAWLTAFVWTQAVEIPVVCAGLRKLALPWWHIALLAAAANSVTHPTLWFVYTATFPAHEPSWLAFVTDDPYLRWVIVAETLVVVTEATAFVLFVRHRAGPGHARRAVLTAAVANVASTLVGLSGVTRV